MRAFLIFLALIPSFAWTALLEQKDLVGRIMVQDQVSNRVSGVMTMTTITKSGVQILDAKLNQFNVDGVNLPSDVACEGKMVTSFRDPRPSLQRLEVRCIDNRKKALISLTLHLSGLTNEQLVSYLNGSFGVGSLSVVDHTNQSKPIQSLAVEFKNLGSGS